MRIHMHAYSPIFLQFLLNSWFCCITEKEISSKYWDGLKSPCKYEGVAAILDCNYHKGPALFACLLCTEWCYPEICHYHDPNHHLSVSPPPPPTPFLFIVEFQLMVLRAFHIPLLQRNVDKT